MTFLSAPASPAYSPTYPQWSPTSPAQGGRNGTNNYSTSPSWMEPRVMRVGMPDALEAPANSFRPPKFLRWHGKASREHLAKKPAINIVPPEMTPSKPRSVREHSFQQLSALRFARCDHCGDKMWGSHLRCTGRCLEPTSRINHTDCSRIRLSYVRPSQVPSSCSFHLCPGR